MSDSISRQAAIEAIEERFFAGTVADINPSWKLLHEIIESLPPVEPQRPKGEWKCMADCGVTECDQCGWNVEEYVGDYNFCPNCGSYNGGDMRGEDND